MKTYREVAKKNKMPLDMETKYLSYMQTRWADNEAINCQCGYAQEWAERFLSHCEFERSDSIGRRVLESL